MTDRKQPHPQRCLHSKMCVWNKGRPGECLDTDCASHRYVYASHSSAAEPEEYIITEEQRQRICRTDTNLFALADEIGSRPVTSHSAVKKQKCKDNTDMVAVFRDGDSTHRFSRGFR